MSNEIKKRFIAGAVCPKCSAMDTVRVYNLEGKDYRECVACDFSDEMHFQPQVRELETRVNTTEEEKKSDVQVLVFPSPEKK